VKLDFFVDHENENIIVMIEFGKLEKIQGLIEVDKH
jgi:hypothetical protein